jgi:hypothetical protein
MTATRTQSSSSSASSSKVQIAPTSNDVTSVTAAPTQSSSSSASSSSKDKLSPLEIVGIILGILGFLVAVATLIINWKTLSEALKQHRNHAS